MIIGCGVLGGYALDMLLRTGDTHEYIAASRRAEALEPRVNLAVLVANNLGFYPSVRTAQIDLRNEEETARQIAHFKPDLVFNATSLQTFWRISTLPDPIYKELDQARVGPWLPMHLTLTYKLMRAVRASGQRLIVVNGSYPDAVNPALQCAGLAPHIGIGNVANAVPGLRQAAAQALDCDPRTVDVRFYAHHYISNRIASVGNAGPAPFRLFVLADGKEVKPALDPGRLFAALITRWKRTRGVPGQVMAASSAVDVIRSIANELNTVLHAPGPNGLPGGYAVRAGTTGVSVVLPEGLSLDEAVTVNKEGGVFDGIERIDDDGTVYFTEREMSVMKRTLGYWCRSLRLEDSEKWANELLVKYREFEGRYK
jgi:hypothetical protein